ncbi:hypothetical protein [Streptomyces sp. MMBL 11-3]|uniref:hypothetical protein n=1 Tax=Streptomyces sp. MMBL 11-3 TaxID=3382639 RepID=UPI0039B6A98B
MLSLYRDHPGPLPPADQHTATAHLQAALILLTAACTGPELESDDEPEGELLLPLAPAQAVIHQATGMISHRHTATPSTTPWTGCAPTPSP